MLSYFLLKSFFAYSLSIWSGSAFFMTLFAAPSAFKVFKKEDAGKFTEFLLGKYFSLSFILSLLCIVSFYLLTKDNLSLISSVNLVLILIASLSNFINLFFLYPKSSKLKALYYEQKEKRVYQEFLKMHKISVFLNLITLLFLLLSIGLTSLYLTF